MADTPISNSRPCEERTRSVRATLDRQRFSTPPATTRISVMRDAPVEDARTRAGRVQHDRRSRSAAAGLTLMERTGKGKGSGPGRAAPAVVRRAAPLRQD